MFCSECSFGEGHESEIGDPAVLGRERTGDARGVFRHGAEIQTDLAAAPVSCEL